ncbi:MAG TPA: methyltransferase [Bacteroidia bacterium]|jgi:SAM-dependent methyltransferase|nr:methyltransferase [Bacteroidia bacterium]
MNQFSESYWTNRYDNNTAVWDAGAITPPIKAYVDQLKNKDLKILIPGAGNGHEAEYLIEKGFKNVVVLDISAAPVENIKKRVPAFPSEQLIIGDFFQHAATYDLIIEQTFLCALDPALQKKYAPQMNKLLKPGGKLIGVLFIEPLHAKEPPFALTKQEYINLFQPYFHIQTLETCYNSIKPRQGRELFMILQKG